VTFLGAAAIIGLNIGNATICAAEVRAAGGRHEVVTMGVVPTPEGTVMGGSIADPEAVGLAVKELIASMGARSKQCISSVAGNSSLVVRVIDVPRMSPKELDEMMKFELERHIPFQANEVILDYKPIHRPNEDPTSPNMEILLAAAQEEMINAHVGTVEKAGLAPRSIDIEPLAAARVLVGLMGGPDETVALLNIGSSASEISVIRDGMLAFTRAVPIGGDQITQAIQEMFQVTRPEAERIKQEVGDCLPAAPAGGYGYEGYAQPDQQAYDPNAYAAQTYDPNAYVQPTTEAPASVDPMAMGGFSFDAPATPAPATADPMSFNLDFAGGAPATESKPAPGGFNFDLGGPSEPVAEAASAPNAFSFDLGGDMSFGGPTEPAEAAPAPNAFDFDLGSAMSFGAPAEPVAEAAPSAFSFDLGDEPAQAASPPNAIDFGTSLEGPPSFEAAAAPASEPAFGFDLDLPATMETAAAAPALDLEMSPVASAPPTEGFGEFAFEAEAVPAPAQVAAHPELDLELGDSPPPMAGAFLPSVEGASAESYAPAELAHVEDDLGVAAMDVYNVIVPVLGELSGETRRSLEYFTGKYPDIPIARIVLLGGGARLKNLDVFLQNEMGIRVTVANPFTHVAVASSNYSEAYLQQVGPMMTVAVGLALRDLMGK